MSLIRVTRPWGEYEVLWSGADKNFNEVVVKVLRVLPEQSLSLQSHQHRSEHWTVAFGYAHAHHQTAHEQGTEETRISVLSAGESIDIPRRTLHRLVNPCQSDLLEVVEVARGLPVVDEEDIVRYADKYGRV